MPKKIEREFLSDDLETLAMTDHEEFGKRVYSISDKLADKMSAARKTRDQWATDAPKQKKRRKNFYEKMDGGDLVMVIIKANDAVRDLISLQYSSSSKRDANREDEIIKEAVKAAVNLENALHEAEELDFEKKIPAGEQFNEHGFKEKLADMEIEVTRGSARLQKYKNIHAQFKNTPSFALYSNEFVRQLNDFDHAINQAESLAAELKTDIDDMNDLLSDDNASEKELKVRIADLEKKQKNIADVVAKIETDTPEMNKEYEQKLKFYNRIFGAARQLNEFKKGPDFDLLPNGRKIVFELLHRAQKIQDQQLTDEEIQDFENEVAKKVFNAVDKIKSEQQAVREAEAAKTEADKVEAENQKEIEKLSTEYRLPIRIESDQIKKMSEELKPLIKFAEYAGSTAGADLDIDPSKIALVKSVERNIWQAGLNIMDLSEAFSGQSKMSLAEIRKRIADYDAEFKAAKNNFDEAMEIIDGVRTRMVHNLRAEFSAVRLSKEHITDREEAILRGLEAMLRNTKDLTWRDIEDVKFILKKNVLAPMGESIKKSLEAGVETQPDLVKPKAEKSAEEMLTGAFPKDESTPSKPEEIKLTRKEIIAEIGEMYKNEGVINLNSQEILDVLQPKDIEAMIEHLRADAMAKSDGNSGEFKRILRESLNKDLLKSLSDETRDKIGEAVIEQTYALLKGAVDAESRAEILRLQTSKAEKFARVGAVGASIAARIGLGVGLGVVSAPVVAATGGAASVVVGAGMVGMNKAIDRLSETAPVKKIKSFFGNLLKRNRPAIDEARVIESTAKATITPEMLANVLSGQLRENTSEELRYRIETFSQLKKSAEHTLSPDAIGKFASSLDDMSKDFYQNSFDYLTLKYADQNLSPETISVVARLMTAEINTNQKNEMNTAEAAEKKPTAVKVMEKITKIKSHSVGAFFFGGCMSLALAEGPAVARVVGGALSGAGLGLMIEGRMRVSADKKIIDKNKELLPAWENISRKSGGAIMSKDWTKYQNDIALMRKNLNEGKFDTDPLTKIRVENLSSRFERMMIERGKVGKKLVAEIAADLNKQLSDYNTVAKKHEKSLMKIFGIKDRRTVFVRAGAVVGAVFGYFMSQGGWHKIMSLFNNEPPVGQTIAFKDQDLPALHRTPGVSITKEEQFSMREVPAEPVARHHVTHQTARRAEEILSAPTAVQTASPIPENPYGNNGGNDLIEEELQKVKISHEVDSDIFEHFDRSEHPRLSDENYQRMLKIYSESGSEKARDYLDSIEHGRGHADRLDSIKHKFGSRMDEAVNKQAEQIKNQMNESPRSATNRVMSELPVERGTEFIINEADADADAGVEDGGVVETDAGAADAQREASVKKALAHAREQSAQAHSIAEDRFQRGVDQLGSNAHQAYDWLNERVNDANLAPDQSVKIKDLMDQFKQSVRSGKISPSLMNEINREMTAHDI
ncbi:MAG: hypothetical protein WC457_00490 [Patescibacteria group bacterium]